MKFTYLIKIIFTLSFFIIQNKVICDVLFKPHVRFIIYNKTNLDLELLNVLHQDCNNKEFKEPYSILFNEENKNRGYTYCFGDTCITEAYGFLEYHKLILTFSDTILQTPIFTLPNWINPTCSIFIYKNRIKVKYDYSFLVYRTFKEIGLALIITLILELLFSIIFIIKIKNKQIILKTVFIANLISVPIIWLINIFLIMLLNLNIFNILGLEVLVIIFEYKIYKKYLIKYLKLEKIKWLSIGANIFSFLLGLLIVYILFMFGIL